MIGRAELEAPPAPARQLADAEVELECLRTLVAELRRIACECPVDAVPNLIVQAIDRARPEAAP
jgi:hypothetical protein